tara:strand:+ start:266 stop:460 length:195 start_codon:yes stop_codon:yes gene_type:complete
VQKDGRDIEIVKNKRGLEIEFGLWNRKKKSSQTFPFPIQQLHIDSLTNYDMTISGCVESIAPGC